MVALVFLLSSGIAILSSSAPNNSGGSRPQPSRYINGAEKPTTFPESRPQPYIKGAEKPTTFPESALQILKGEGWELVNFANASFRQDLNYSCEFVPFVSTSGNTAEMCVHTLRDLVSNHIRSKKRWSDCDPLPRLWNENVDKNNSSTASPTDRVYVEIGANIGSCVLEMLLSTDANIVAFEPHPLNQYVLHNTLARLGPEYQRRVALVPVALGGSVGASSIYTGEGNMGNSVVGKAIKDFPKQQLKKPVDIRIERLDSILLGDVPIPLLKLDAQGFECHILDGISASIAGNIRTLKFEMASKWLKKQQCFDLLPRLKKLNFTITSTHGIVVDADEYHCPICDLYAKRSR